MSAILKVVSFLLILIALSACGDSWSWHQKLTVIVETPTGQKSASSVIEATFTHSAGPLTAPEARGAVLRLKGEAVVVEVLPGKYLFALLKDMPDPYGLFFPGEDPLDAAPKLENIATPVTATVSPYSYPMLVTFTDIENPASVKELGPYKLEAAFGPGYQVSSITMTITDEPMTKGKVESVLGWLNQYYDKKLDRRRFETIEAINRFANSLSAGDFDTEKN